MNAGGAPQWPSNGVALSTAPNQQGLPSITSDGAGGAIVTWHDYRNGTDDDIYAQRVSPAGAALWTYNGVPVSTAAGSQYVPTIASDIACHSSAV